MIFLIQQGSKGGTTTKETITGDLVYDRVNREAITVNPEFVPVLNQFGEYLSTVICGMSSISRVKVEEYQLLQGIQQILQDNFPLIEQYIFLT